MVARRMRLAVFKDHFVACTLGRYEILADLSERIKSELRKLVIESPPIVDPFFGHVRFEAEFECSRICQEPLTHHLLLRLQ